MTARATKATGTTIMKATRTAVAEELVACAVLIEKSSTFLVAIFKTFNCFELVRSLKQDLRKSTLESLRPYEEIYSSDVMRQNPFLHFQ